MLMIHRYPRRCASVYEFIYRYTLSEQDEVIYTTMSVQLNVSRMQLNCLLSTLDILHPQRQNVRERKIGNRSEGENCAKQRDRKSLRVSNFVADNRYIGGGRPNGNGEIEG